MSGTEGELTGWQLRRQGLEAELRLTDDWVVGVARTGSAGGPRRIVADLGEATRLRFDVSGLGRWDSTLIVFLQSLRSALLEKTAGARPVELDESGLPDPARRLLAMAAEAAPTAPPAQAPTVPLLARIGTRAIGAGTAVVDVASLVGETLLCAGSALGGRARMRAVEVWELVREAGPGALVIVTIVNGLVGAILAFVGAVQLRRFGAEIYVANLVGVAMVREMAAVMTAIVMVGRSGGAFAAHIATMQGNEEIDALRAFGIPVHDYLVLPRVLALVAMMPVLYVYGCAVALLGGLAVGMATLDLSPVAYIEQTRASLDGTQFLIGACKSVAFAVLVALAGCHIGLRAGRSSAEVGRAATSAVVAGIIGVIVLDAVFAICADALGI